MLIPAINPRIQPSVSYLGNDYSTTDGSSFTFSSKTLGDADGGRLIVVCVQGGVNGGSKNITGVTVGGITATIEANNNKTNSNTSGCIAYASVPTGTTGNIVVTFDGTEQECDISWYRIINLDSTTPSYANQTFGGASSAALSLSSINVPSYGIAIANSVAQRSGIDLAHAYSGTVGVVEDVETYRDSLWHHATGNIQATTAVSSGGVTATWSGSNNDYPILQVAVWR